MSIEIDRRQRQLNGYAVAGLGGLSVSSVAGAIREFGLGGWIETGGLSDRAFLGVWVIGLVMFGVAFTGLSVIGRRLRPQEREVLDDELAHFLTRRASAFAFVLTFVAAVIFAAIPGASDLSGRAVALSIVGVASGALAIARRWAP